MLNINDEAAASSPLLSSVVRLLSAAMGAGSLVVLVSGIVYLQRVSMSAVGQGMLTLATLVAAFVLAALAWGLWRMRGWARTAVSALAGVVVLYSAVRVVFDFSTEIFAGEQVLGLGAIALALGEGALHFVLLAALPIALIYFLGRVATRFEESPTERDVADRTIRNVLLLSALSSLFIVFLIMVFTAAESTEAVREIGLERMLLGTVWRPGSIIGHVGQYGLIPMILGSVLATIGAIVLGVPLSVGTAILLAEIAPPTVRELLRPAVELLAGIPSVVYGLFGMVVLAPLIRVIDISGNTGFGLLNASIVLAVMIIPTVTNISEDAIRAVPQHFREASLALGATHWQTIRSVVLPGARSGIIAAIILGIGRALGETMAVIMVIGNSIAIPKPLTGNPLTLFLSSARTLTGNIAVEINYAAGAHRSALFFTGVLLFVLLLAVNSMARFLMQESAR